jgi:hypothetical protein
MIDLTAPAGIDALGPDHSGRLAETTNYPRRIDGSFHISKQH